MTKITDQIWIGNSSDAAHADLEGAKIDAVLNCAHDLVVSRGWNHGLHVAHCGLVDGPGNSMAAYYSAVMQLAHLVSAGKRVLVHCHKGESRSVAVVIMYLNAKSRMGWNHWRGEIKAAGREIPDSMPQDAHRRAFNEMDWNKFAGVIS